MSIQNEPFSDLLNKHTLITIELARLSALMVYYSDSGHKAKLAQTIDAIKRLELNKSAISIELDKRTQNGPNTEDELRTSS